MTVNYFGIRVDTNWIPILNEIFDISIKIVWISFDEFCKGPSLT